MNTMYSRNSDLEEDDEPVGRDREITLGTSFIVGIFFALVLICAIFFAFGYSLGRRSALPASGVPPAAAPASAHRLQRLQTFFGHSRSPACACNLVQRCRHIRYGRPGERPGSQPARRNAGPSHGSGSSRASRQTER